MLPKTSHINSLPSSYSKLFLTPKNRRAPIILQVTMSAQAVETATGKTTEVTIL